MGQIAGEQRKDKNIDLGNWIEAVQDPNNSLFTNVNPFRKRLLVNKKTNQLIEQYEMQFLNQDDFSSYSKEIQRRKQMNNNIKLQMLSSEQAPYTVSPYIYKVKQFTNTSVQELCSTIYNGLLYIAKIELRLKQITDIPFSDQLYLYRACLQGFRILYEQVGYFDITEEMIFADRDGKVKVWMNPNLSKHHPNYEPDVNQNSNFTTIEIQGSQSEMLKNLIEIIQVNGDSLDHRVHFRQYLTSKGVIERLSFYKALDEFHQYVEQNHYHINNHMKSIRDLFHDEDHLQDNQTQNSLANLHKDYESLKNSTYNDLSFENIPISSKKKLTPSNGNNIAGSKVSKQSYNSEFNMKKINSQAKINYLQRSPVYDNVSQYQNTSNLPIQHSKLAKHSNMTSNALLHSRKLPPPVFQQQVIPIYPPQFKIIPQSDIAKYKSPEKSHLVLSQKPITFSYQHQSNIPRIDDKNITISKQSENTKKYQKIQIIDNLNTPILIKTGFKHSQETKLNKNNQQILHPIPNLLNYYSNSEIFELDREIAQDMAKYLGFQSNPR